MSVDYGLDMGIGWFLNQEQTQELFKSLKKELEPEVSHLQKRFSPTTGQELNPKLVIDKEARIGYLIGDKEVEEEDDLIDAFNELLQACQLVPIHDYEGNIQLIIAINAKPVQDEKTSIDVTEDDSLRFYVPQNLGDLVSVARMELKKVLGLEFGALEFIAGISCC